MDRAALIALFETRIGKLDTGAFLADPALVGLIEPLIHRFAEAEIAAIEARLTGPAPAEAMAAILRARPRIALTNIELNIFGGSQMWTADMARYLNGLGLPLIVYSPWLGELAAMLGREGIRVTDEPGDVDAFAPDLLHVNHAAECAAALDAVGPEPVVVNTIHGLLPPPERADAARVDAYLAVALHAKARIHLTTGTPWEAIALTPNFFDAARFRLCPPATRGRALLFSSKTTAEQRARLAEMLAGAGYTLDHTGYGGIPSAAPEEILPRYDVVFAVARSAIEALASGCRVVLWDAGIVGPMVTGENFWRCVAANFSMLGCVLPWKAIEDGEAESWLHAQIAHSGHRSATEMTWRHLSLDRIGPLILGEYAKAMAARGRAV